MNSYPCLPTHFLRYFSRICACWPALLLQLLQPSFSSSFHNSSFFFPLSFFFSLKMWFLYVTVSSAEGTSWRWAGFVGRSWSDWICRFSRMYKLLPLTEPVHLSQESTNNLLQNVTRYVIPEACSNIVYSIASAKRDAFHDTSSISKTRVTSVTVMGDP